MKTLKLVFSRLNFYFTSNKLVFIMFLIGSFICSIVFIFFYGNQISAKTAEGSLDPSYSYYSLSFSEPVSYGSVINSELLKSDKVLDVDISYSLSFDELPDATFVKGVDKKSFDGFFSVVTQVNMKNKIFSKMGRVEFTDDEIASGKNVVILPNFEYYYSIKQGDSITLSNKKYEVIGMSSYNFEFYITPKTYETCGYAVENIKIHTIDRMSRTENDQFILDIEEEFPGGYLYESPTISYESSEASLMNDILFIACEFIIASLSFMFLMKFMIERSNSENVIYSIVGATKGKVISILIIENMIISSAVAILASVVHWLLYDSLFDHINVYSGIGYTFSDYVIIIFGIIILSGITSVPFIVSCVRNSVIRNKNKYN